MVASNVFNLSWRLLLFSLINQRGVSVVNLENLWCSLWTCDLFVGWAIESASIILFVGFDWPLFRGWTPATGVWVHGQWVSPGASLPKWRYGHLCNIPLYMCFVHLYQIESEVIKAVSCCSEVHTALRHQLMRSIWAWSAPRVSWPLAWVGKIFWFHS
jgi:hypothetical protein